MIVRNLITQIYPVASSLVFPLYCPNCGMQMQNGKGWMCDECWSSLTAPGKKRASLSKKKQIRLDTAFSYSDSTRRMIHHMKFFGRMDIAKEIGYRMHDRLGGLLEGIDLAGVAPVPLHPVRIRERGYDQNLIIAQSLAEMLNIPVLNRIIERTRNTPPQSRLSDVERLRNLSGAISPVEHEHEPVEGTVLLVDDVIHTGATLIECIKALAQAGVRDIMILVAFG